MKKIFHSLTLAMFLVFSILTACSEDESVSPNLSGPQPTPSPSPSPSPSPLPSPTPPSSPPPAPPIDHKAPIAQAGNDTTIYLPFNSHTLNGGASTGSSLTYQWVLIKGPAVEGTIDFGFQDNPKRFVDGLVNVGVYEFELTVTDSFKLTSKDIVKVTVAVPNCTSANKEVILKDLQWTHPWYTQISISNVFSYLPANSYIKNFYIKRDGSDQWELIVPWDKETAIYNGQYTWEHVEYTEFNSWVLVIYPNSYDANDTPDVKIEYCN